MELTEDFLKLLEIAIIIVGVGSIFFTYINYNITVSQDSAGRNAIVLANYLLDNRCLTYQGTKGLFDSAKFSSVAKSCFSYPYGSFKITLQSGRSWSFSIGPDDEQGEARLTVSVRTEKGEVVPATLEVSV